MNKCLNCQKEVKNKYCNVSCQNSHQWKGRKKSKESLQKREETKKKKWKTFNVNCHKCNSDFQIEEYNVDEPKKEKYFCSRSCANSRERSSSFKEKISEIAKNSEAVKKANRENGKNRKGKSYPQMRGNRVERIKTLCLHCGKDIKHKINETRKYHKECWLKCSGGFREGSSRGKSGWYKGYWCDSSWELAWVIYQLDHGNKFERNKIGFPYQFKGKESLFYPDFIVGEKYVEVKNFNSKRLEAKLNHFPHEIEVLYKEGLVHEFEYVEEKYGKNYIELYE